MFIEEESYKHKLSKELLYSWIEAKNRNDTQNYPEDFILPFVWQTDGQDNVHLELPFFETTGLYYFQSMHQGKTVFIPDITIFHKGVASIFIEVIHKCPVTDEKLERINAFYKNRPPSLYTIDAENILCQTNIKFKLEFTKLL